MVMEEQRETPMEAPPSPQTVGREFVRQYYTLLNKSPACMHRFYGPNSSFLHGGLDPSNCETAAVFGQKQIHNKVQQLNFRDCHAKILQVDSLATIGGGVVIQVTGELSNAGQPMRRFSQTFILAVKTAKSYYVYNDIFRYQDEIISDEEYSSEEHPENETNPNQSERPILNDSQQVLSQPVVSAAVLAPFYGGAVQSVQAPPAQVQPAVNQAAAAVAAPVVAAHQQPIPAQIVQSNQAVTLNGHQEELGALAGQSISGHLPPVSRQFVPQPMVEPLNQAVVAPTVEETRHEIEVATEVSPVNNATGYANVVEPENEPEIPQEPVSNEPKTYANRLKATSSVVGPQAQGIFQQQSLNTFASPPISINVNINRAPPAAAATAAANANAATAVATGITSNNNNNNNVTLASSGIGNGNGPVRSYNRGSFPQSRNNGIQQNRGPRLNDDGDRRRSQSFGQSNDSNQLFLGNLPHAATEDQLRDIFSEFGTILEFKMFKTQTGNAGGNKPGQSGRAPPNYAFITYECQQNVSACLSAKPIFYPRNDSTGTQLNIEMKRIGGGNNGNLRLGGDNNGGGIGGGRLSGNRGNNDSQRRGGNSGGNRGGQQGGNGPQGGGPGDRNRIQGDRYNRGGGGPPGGNRASNNYSRR